MNEPMVSSSPQPEGAVKKGRPDRRYSRAVRWLTTLQDTEYGEGAEEGQQDGTVVPRQNEQGGVSPRDPYGKITPGGIFVGVPGGGTKQVGEINAKQVLMARREGQKETAMSGEADNQVSTQEEISQQQQPSTPATPVPEQELQPGDVAPQGVPPGRRRVQKRGLHQATQEDLTGVRESVRISGPFGSNSTFYREVHITPEIVVLMAGLTDDFYSPPVLPDSLTLVYQRKEYTVYSLGLEFALDSMQRRFLVLLRKG